MAERSPRSHARAKACDGGALRVDEAGAGDHAGAEGEQGDGQEGHAARPGRRRVRRAGGQEGGAGGAPRGARPRHVQGILTAPSSGRRTVPDTRRRAGTLGDVTGLDWIIVGLVLLLALFGWAQGFLTGALALVGLALGAFVGTRIGPLVLSDGAHSPYAPLFGLLGALLLGGLLAGLFEAFGGRLRKRLGRLPGVSAADGLLGAVLVACAGLGIVWILGAFAVQRGGYELREEVRRSSILQRLNTIAAALGAAAQLARPARPVPAHRRAGGRRRAAAAGDPARPHRPGRGGQRGQDPRHRVRAGRGGLGLGGRARPRRHERPRRGRPARHARARCAAAAGACAARRCGSTPATTSPILRVDGLDAPALPLARSPESGTSAAILGFPLNGPYDVRPGRWGTRGA